MVLTWWLVAGLVGVVAFVAGPYLVDLYYWWKHARPFQPGWRAARKVRKQRKAQRKK